MIYSRNLGLHFPYLSFSFKVIFSLSNWRIQGSYDVSKKDYESISRSLVCTAFCKAPLQFFLLEASCDLNRKYDLVAVGALTYSGIHITYSPLRLTELPGLVGPPEVCAHWALWMRRACTFPACLCAPLSHRLHLQTPPERQNQKLLDGDKEQSIKPSLHPSKHQS